MKKKAINLNTSYEQDTSMDLEVLEEVVDRLSKKVKKIIKKNGFSKNLKEKAEADL